MVARQSKMAVTNHNTEQGWQSSSDTPLNTRIQSLRKPSDVFKDFKRRKGSQVEKRRRRRRERGAKGEDLQTSPATYRHPGVTGLSPGLPEKGDQTQCKHTHKHGEPKTNTWTDKRRPTRESWVFRPPEFSCLPVLGSSYPMASTAHQTWDQERNSPSHRAGCLPARSLASVLHRLEHPIRSPFIESLLLCQITSCLTAGPWIYTGLSCPA